MLLPTPEEYYVMTVICDWLRGVELPERYKPAAASACKHDWLQPSDDGYRITDKGYQILRKADKIVSKAGDKAVRKAWKEGKFTDRPIFHGRRAETCPNEALYQKIFHEAGAKALRTACNALR